MTARAEPAPAQAAPVHVAPVHVASIKGAPAQRAKAEPAVAPPAKARPRTSPAGASPGRDPIGDRLAALFLAPPAPQPHQPQPQPPAAAAPEPPPALARAEPAPDCADARTPARRMVCEDPQLAAADRRMARAYRAAVAAGAPERQLRLEQRDWLDLRDDAARRSRRAVADVYQQRIEDLEQWRDEAAARDPEL